MTWSPATETQANVVAFKAAAVADADPGQDRDFLPAQSRDAVVRASQAEYFPQGAGRPEARRDDTDDHPPAPSSARSSHRHLAGQPSNDERQHARIPARGVSRRLTRLSLPGRTSSRCLLSTRLRARGRLPAEEARSPQAVPEGSFLLHTQEELAPRNLLDNTVRCLMPFLARGHHSPDEAVGTAARRLAGSGVSSGSRS
jgi:hypothetical protein